MVLCIVALIVFSIMSVGSAKYRSWAREALRCVIKNLTLSPCDVALEQKIKGKVTAKLLAFPALARFFYWNFRVIAWLFTITFFASLIYTGYSIYNLFVFGSFFYHDFIWWPWVGKKLQAEHVKKTKWGRLFESYPEN